MKNIAVLISGNGTNLQALIDAERQKYFKENARIALVISNNPNAYGIERAKHAVMKTAVINHENYDSREKHEEQILKVLSENNIDLIVLAGYMRILSPSFINKYSNSIINIHPALLPAFPGMNAQEQAINYGVKITGCTTHFVDNGVDTGPIILQKAININDNDTIELLKQKLLVEEHKLLKKSVLLFCENKITVNKRKVYIKE